MKTGIQVSSFRPVLTTEEQVRTAFDKMAAMGCGVVQLQWIDPSVSIDFIAECLQQTGIRSVGVQDFYQTVLENKAYYYELNGRTGGTWICVSRIPERLKSRAGLDGYVQELKAMQRELEEIGQRLCFHPVSADFVPIDGLNPVEYILDACPELDICFDLYHLNKSGLDMCRWIQKYAGRVCMVHFKEGRRLPDGTEQLVPVGQGDTDWTGVAEICRDTGVDYAFVEQERWDRDPFDCLREGLDWLKEKVKIR